MGGLDGTIVGAAPAAFWANTCPDGSPCGTYDGAGVYLNNIGTGLAIPGGGISIVVGVKPMGPGFDVIQRSVLCKRMAAGSVSYIFRLDGDPPRIEFLFYDSGLNWHFYVTTTTYPLGQWYVFTLSYIFGVGSSMVVYNGAVPAAGSWVMGDGNGVPLAVNQTVHVGNYCPDAGDVGGSQHFQGLKGDILLYCKALSLDEVRENFEVARSRYGL
jgi:hypothetical protein